MKNLFYCSDLLLHCCCGSCHDDADNGYGDLTEFETASSVYRLCCRVADEYQAILEERGILWSY